MTQDLRFRVKLYPIPKYEERRRLTIKVQDGSGYSAPCIDFEWHLNTEEPTSRGWYGCDLTIVAKSKDNLDRLVGIARRVIGRPEYGYDVFDPHEIVERLRRLKVVEEAYDPRLSDYVPLPQLKGPEYECWADDNEALGEQYIYTTVLARSEYEAKELIAEKFNTIYRSDNSEAHFAAWILAGRPVKIHTRSPFYGSTELDYRTAEQKIAETEAECAPEPEAEEATDG